MSTESVASFIRDTRVRVVVLLLLIAGGATYAVVVGIPSPDRVDGFLAAHRYLAPVVGILGICAATVVMVPRAAVALLAGVLFGPILGAGYTTIGAALGALVAFTLGRILGRDFVARLARGRLERLDSWLAGHGVLAVAWTRLVPVVPFGLLNYGFGVTRVGTGRFALGTLLGILPSTLVYAWAGASAQHLRSPLLLAGVGVMVVVTMAGTMLARSRRAAPRSLSKDPAHCDAGVEDDEGDRRTRWRRA